MKCADCEREIYLCNELTQQEREKIDAHVSTCTHCAQVYSVVRELHKVVELNRGEIPALKNHAAMTHRIMEAVEARRKRKRPQLTEVFQRIIVAPMRYQMVVFSIILVVFFAKEYGSGIAEPKIVKAYRQDPGPKTELNLAAFHTVFFETKKTNNQSPNTISDCVARCLEASSVDCKRCVEKFIKP